MVTVDETHKIYTYQTGKFSMMSSRGNMYVLIMYVYDANAILEEPFERRSVSHILEAYTNQVEHLKNRGYRPRVNWMDNESYASPNKYN